MVYFDGPISAGSLMSRVLASGAAIDVGYHLLSGQEPAIDDIRTSQACHDDVLMSILSNYNMKNQTAFNQLADLPDPDAARLLLISMMQDRGCSLAYLGGLLQIVGPRDDQHVSVEITAPAEPADGSGIPFPPPEPSLFNIFGIY